MYSFHCILSVSIATQNHRPFTLTLQQFIYLCQLISVGITCWEFVGFDLHTAHCSNVPLSNARFNKLTLRNRFYSKQKGK